MICSNPGPTFVIEEIDAERALRDVTLLSKTRSNKAEITIINTYRNKKLKTPDTSSSSRAFPLIFTVDITFGLILLLISI